MKGEVIMMAKGKNAQEGKVKKPLFKKWWFWVIVVLVVGVIGAAMGGGEEQTANEPSSSVDQPSESPVESAGPSESPEPSEPEAEPSESTPIVTETDKETAKALDAEILSLCTKAEQDYNAFLTFVSTNGTTNLDAYNAAKTLKENLTDYNYRQLTKLEGNGLEEYDEYKQNASLYIYMMSEVADAAMVYLDDNKTSNLSAYQDAVEGVSTYSLPVVASRLTFLSASGLSDEEINALVDTSASE